MGNVLNSKYIALKDVVDVAVNVGGFIPAGALYGGMLKLYLKQVNQI